MGEKIFNDLIKIKAELKTQTKLMFLKKNVSMTWIVLKSYTQLNCT